MSDVIFRCAQPPDWPALATLLAAANLPLDGAQDHLADFVLAVRDAELIGTAALERYGDYGLLRSVAVIASEHGRGKQQSRKTEFTENRKSGFTQRRADH